MKKLFLPLLGVFALCAACDSGYKPDGADLAATQKTSAQPTEAAQPASGLNPDSAADVKLAAVTNQVQVDTSATHMGNEATGTPTGGPGAKLIAASDCASCHKEREKLLGPAYTDVAKKYPATPANIAMLSQHIIKGGAGHWGNIAMTPHPGLSSADSKEMVKYILSLK